MYESNRPFLMINPTQRIQALLDYTGLNAKKFSERIGEKTPDIIYHIQRGRNDISKRLADNIGMAFPQINRGWLLSGEGDMLRDGTAGEGAGTLDPPVVWTPPRRKATPNLSATQQVPLYELEAVAGLVPVFDHKHQPVNYLSIPDLPRCDGAVYVRGDSMYPLLKSGDIVIYKQIQDFYNIIWGEMYLISFNYDGEEYITVKFIKQVEEHPELVLLVSHNAHHAPKQIPVSSIRALAMVKASVRFNTMG